MIVPYTDCKGDVKCVALVKALIAEKHGDVLQYQDDGCEDTAKYAPGQYATKL